MGTFDSYTKVNDLEASDTLLVETENGTRGITGEHLMKSGSRLLSGDEYYDLLDQFAPVEVRRNTFRGKSLGTSFTAAQKATIADGSFKGYFLGDYWTLNGILYRIVDINYWLRTGDTECTTPHLVMMPDVALHNSKMNETDTTAGGYVESYMRTIDIPGAPTGAITVAFGSNYILSHREYLTNSVTSGHPSNGAWYDSKVELPNEIMMYGSYVFTAAGDGSFVPNRYTTNKTQLALMAAHPRYINPARQTQWLRDVVSSASFAGVGSYGTAAYYAASDSRGVRPVFGLTGGESA